ncbi:nicotinamide-nucleotide amidohydrolase family protein [Pseudorhodobacter sp.]|uniref:CinA family protein n=1 Tax=Pseudorhodobacter sp. TaxID=1934400 RepID=UPI002AFFBBC3|nr:nicotinamide-nucleotide amidohydrolase family protein [Pseudorhodobacter sp.]
MSAEDLAARILAAARARGFTIATAESCTGGLVAAALTEIPGSSDVFDRGFVTYSNPAKIAMLGVSPETLATDGAVSEAVAVEMAAGALRQAGVALAVSITGIAGPGGSAHKPEGRVCFGLAQRGQPTRTETREFGAIGRANVRRAATSHALHLLAAALR